jgi:hypothetical protein
LVLEVAAEQVVVRVLRLVLLGLLTQAVVVAAALG